MNMNLTNDEWLSAWSGFLETISTIFMRKREFVITVNQRARLDAVIKELTQLLVLLRQLRREELDTVLRSAERDQRGRVAIALTGAEMSYLNQHYGRGQIESKEEADGGIEAAKSVKDSIEKLFTWIPGHKTILTGLNEVLSLGRAV